MRQPGIDVRPIRQLDGESKFNEVFLDNARVSPADVLGEVGHGWRVALSTLGRERRMLGSLAVGLGTRLADLRALAEAANLADARFRDRWSALWYEVQLLRWTWFRLLSGDGDSATDPRMSVLKLASSELQQTVARFAIDVLGPALVSEPGAAQWRDAFLTSHGSTIAGGTSEIQRNILGERVLGLPR